MYQKGLKYYFQKTSGAGIRLRIEMLFYELKYAVQRAWRGYADPDTWDITDEIIVTIPQLLKEYRKTHHCLFTDNETEATLSDAETNAVIDDLIFHLENCDADVIYERIFGISPYDEPTMNKNRWRQVYSEREHCKNEAIRLLNKWMWQLWD